MSAEREIDVIVAGAGGAGTCAALAAAGGGLSVLLLDHLGSFRRGCNTYMSTSMIPAAGTRWQREAGVDDSPTLFLADVMSKTKGTTYGVVAKALTEVGPELIEWLADDLGLPLELATDFTYPGHSRFRCHTVAERSGHALHGHLMSRIDSAAGITLATPMELRSVSLGAAGDVQSVTIAGPDGGEESIPTGAVILATGGFGANHELVSKLIPEIAGAMYFGSEGCTGDGLRVGQRLGADLGYLDSYQGHGSVAVDLEIMVTWATVMHGAILVNADGQRFGDETTGYSEYAREVLKQPGGVAWVVVNEAIDGLCRPFADYTNLVDHGGVKWCPTLNEAGARIGCPPAALRETLALSQQARLGSADDAYGRRLWETPLAAPFGLIKVTGALFHTQGGLLTDGHGAVLKDGSPIPGLFAAGGAAAGISGHGPDGYLAGNGLLAALGLGYLAGLAAASVTTGRA